MIKLDCFTYTDEQWDEIKTVVRDRLGLDADQIESRARECWQLSTTRRVAAELHRDGGGMLTFSAVRSKARRRDTRPASSN